MRSYYHIPPTYTCVHCTGKSLWWPSMYPHTAHPPTTTNLPTRPYPHTTLPPNTTLPPHDLPLILPPPTLPYPTLPYPHTTLPPHYPTPNISHPPTLHPTPHITLPPHYLTSILPHPPQNTRDSLLHCQSNSALHQWHGHTKATNGDWKVSHWVSTRGTQSYRDAHAFIVS